MFSQLAGKPPRRLPVCDLSGHVPDTLQPVWGAPSLRLLAQASVAVPAHRPAALTVGLSAGHTWPRAHLAPGPAPTLLRLCGSQAHMTGWPPQGQGGFGSWRPGALALRGEE